MEKLQTIESLTAEVERLTRVNKRLRKKIADNNRQWQGLVDQLKKEKKMFNDVLQFGSVVDGFTRSVRELSEHFTPEALCTFNQSATVLCDEIELQISK